VKKYQVIYCDAPWKYGSRGARAGKFSDLDYSCMSISDLKRFDVDSIADDTAHLYMWVTSPFLKDCHELAEAWGFRRYIRCAKVWNKKKESGKPHGVCGPHGMTDCEFLLMYARGKSTTSLYNDSKRNQYTATDLPFTGKHSEKPVEFRQMIESKYNPEINKLEMFARYSVPGWDVFGNEAPNSIEIDFKEK
jgi:N6-adenosine-specific RNA methylase IME4